MMDLQTIHKLSEEAGEQAEQCGKQPLVLTQAEIGRLKKGDIAGIRGMPNLGTFLPQGWARVKLGKEHGVYTDDNEGYGAFFVDSSGFGKTGEAALSLREFVGKLKSGLGYGIVEEGQFQVKIGAFAVITRH